MLWQVFGLEQAPAQEAVLSVEPVRKGRELSERINALIADLRKGRPVFPQCFVVRQGMYPATAQLVLACAAGCTVIGGFRMLYCLPEHPDAACELFTLGVYNDAYALVVYQKTHGLFCLVWCSVSCTDLTVVKALGNPTDGNRGECCLTIADQAVFKLCDLRSGCLTMQGPQLSSICILC